MSTIGYLIRNRFYCIGCANKIVSELTPIKVCKENLGSYSQTCQLCRTKIALGKFETDLYPLVKEEFEFGFNDLRNLESTLNQAIIEEDWESARSVRDEIYEKFILAVLHKRLFDVADCEHRMKKILTVKLKW